MQRQQLLDARVVVTGGAGFLGSHLCDRLVAAGSEVVVVDNLVTGSPGNLDAAAATGRLTMVEADVSEHLTVTGDVTHVVHMASPASPVDYLRLPIPTLKVGALGTHNALGLARAHQAVLLLASTSEVYGDPAVHPQPESYRGNVDPIGPRGVYDEAKRFAEALATAYQRSHGMQVRIARIFNTFGPRMRTDDGRLVPSLLAQARAGTPLTVHGDGRQTRTLCYVDDLVDGLLRLLCSDVEGPVNLGGSQEMSVLEIARLVGELVDGPSVTTHVARPTDDPQRRRPDLTRARQLLGWQPTTSVREGLRRTLAWFDRQPADVDAVG